VAFVDLVKAYETAKHNLTLNILERNGANPCPCFVAAVAVERICHVLIVVIKRKKEVLYLPQIVGVRHSTSMAPVLFLLLVSVFAETLKVAWKEAGIKVCIVRSVVRSRLAAGNRKGRGHMPNEYLAGDLTDVEIFQCLFVDNGAFIFSSRENLSCGIELSSTPSLRGAAHWMREYFL
jgi:hypothetical protein